MRRPVVRRGRGVSPAGGSQLLTAPDADVGGSPALDIEEVLATADASSGGVGLFTPIAVGSGATNYGAGITAALSIAAASSLPNRIVVFVSDGLNNSGTPVSTVLASPPAGVVFHTFAVGASASCTGGSPALGTLQDIANITGGTCTNVPNVSALDINAKGQITRITSDEVEDGVGNGDGKTCLDAVINSATSASLRAEREGTADGRVYTIYFRVYDDAQNYTEASCQAQVVHDQSPANAVAIDSGCAFCTGSGCGACPQPDPSCGN